jgi:hypothetical protein
MFKYSLILAGVIGMPTVANANCVSNAEAKTQSYGVGDIFSEFFNEQGNEVVIYKLKDRKEFLAAEKSVTCVTSMQIIDKDELSERYGIEDESDCEECAGVAEADGEVQASEGVDLVAGNGERATTDLKVDASPDTLSGQSTVFRGISLGMSKEQAMAVAVDGFTTSYQKGMKLENGFFTGNFVSFLDGRGNSCASLRLTEGREIADKLTMRECFFRLQNATLESFSQKFSESYKVGEMSNDFSQLNNGMEEVYEGMTPFNESVKIAKRVTHHKSLGRIVLPIEVEVEAPFNEAAFD